MDTGYLTSDSLFAQVPKSDGTLPNFYDIDYVSSASNQELIDCTYWLLRKGTLSVEQTLKLWELRLTLTLFNDQLQIAKREAVNLNNALYIRENPNAQPKPTSDDHSRSRANSIGVVYPLPKNNNGLVGFQLLLMMLRLKSVPNLILVNELYKLCYQLRLKGNSSEAVQVQTKLTNISYEVIVVLVITRNYFTLLSFLDSLRHDVKVKINKSEKKSHNDRFYSNVTLLKLIVTLLIWTKGKSKNDLIDLPTEITQLFGSVDETSLASLKHVLQNISSVVGGQVSDIETNNFLLETLTQLIWEKQVSARIICCSIAMWELSNIYHTELLEEDGKSRLVVEAVEETDTDFDQVYAAIMPRWGAYIHKMYGVE